LLEHHRIGVSVSAMNRSCAVSVSLVAVVASVAGCAMAGIQAASNRMSEAQRNKELAHAPEAKAYWAGIYACHTQGAAWPTDTSGGQKGADNDYRKCLDANAKKQIDALRVKAETQKAWSERAPTLRLAACIDQHDTKASFTPFPDLETCAEKYPVQEDAAAKSVRNDYADAEKKGTPAARIEFLQKHPEDERGLDVARRVVKQAGEVDADTQISLDEQITKTWPPAVKDMPAVRRVVIVGPKGLRVRDIQKMQAAKLAPSVVMARIRASKEPYKSFDADELVVLKQMDIPDDVVTAMIEVTTKIQDSREALQERESLRGEIDALKKLVAEKKADKQAGGASGRTVQTKDGPLDVLESCAKRLAAMKLCEQLPFPGSTICTSGVESEFPCPQ
jgi:hypothetical protein